MKKKFPYKKFATHVPLYEGATLVALFIFLNDFFANPAFWGAFYVWWFASIVMLPVMGAALWERVPPQSIVALYRGNRREVSMFLVALMLFFAGIRGL